jgi:hypothetical protein
MPANYSDGFTSCQGDSGMYVSGLHHPLSVLTLSSTSPMGLYPQADGSTSTFYQGQSSTPTAHPAPATSDCTTFTSSSLFASLPTDSPVAPSGVTITPSTTIAYSTPTTPHTTTASPTGAGVSMRESLVRNILVASLVVFVMSLLVVA